MDYSKTKPESIQYLFGNIANKYDKANAILSFGLHHFWNKKLVKEFSSQKNKTYLDLCSGTGEIALRFVKSNPDSKKIILLDFCKEMLDIAEAKFDKPKMPKNIEYLVADAQKLPLDSKSIDSISMAYGIRNVKAPELAIREAYRVLTPGGKMAILELTKPENPLLKFGHHLYLKGLLPIIGKFITENKKAYQYLCESIHQFVPPLEIKNKMQEAGFQQIKIKKLNFGIATLITAQKPLE